MLFFHRRPCGEASWRHLPFGMDVLQSLPYPYGRMRDVGGSVGRISITASTPRWIYLSLLWFWFILVYRTPLTMPHTVLFKGTTSLILINSLSPYFDYLFFHFFTYLTSILGYYVLTYVPTPTPLPQSLFHPHFVAHFTHGAHLYLLIQIFPLSLYSQALPQTP